MWSTRREQRDFHFFNGLLVLKFISVCGHEKDWFSLGCCLRCRYSLDNLLVTYLL